MVMVTVVESFEGDRKRRLVGGRVLEGLHLVRAYADMACLNALCGGCRTVVVYKQVELPYYYSAVNLRFSVANWTGGQNGSLKEFENLKSIVFQLFDSRMGERLRPHLGWAESQRLGLLAFPVMATKLSRLR